MTKPKLNLIHPALGVSQLPDGDLLARLNAVYDGMFNNPAYLTPPVDMVTFKTTIDGYTTAAAAAAIDRGKSITVQRDKYRVAAIRMLRLLGHYVESACKDDMAVFLSSGFVVAPARQTAPPQPVSIPLIISVNQGNTGQCFVNIKPVAKARGYDVRYAPVAPAGNSVNWLVTRAVSAKPAVPINNLTPGVIYAFQVRALGKLGLSDWSSSVERMCI